MSVRPGARRVLLWVLLMLVLGVVCGLVWQWQAEPAEYVVSDRGAVLDQEGARGQFGVIVLFVGLGAAASLMWGVAVGRVLRGLGWLLVPVTVLACSAAAVVAWRLGVALGPPDPAGVGGAGIGDTIPARLAVDSLAAFVVWPVLGLAGVLWMTYFSREPTP